MIREQAWFSCPFPEACLVPQPILPWLPWGMEPVHFTPTVAPPCLATQLPPRQDLGFCGFNFSWSLITTGKQLADHEKNNPEMSQEVQDAALF